ncbi:MAG: sugar-transfer associated ATP-grasp domain-containing protein [Gemmatimonadota bacterium]
MTLTGLRHRVSSSLHALRGTWGFEFPPRLAPWSRLRDADGVEERLRLAATRARRLGGTTILGRARLLLFSAFWYVKATVDAVTQVIHHGGRARELTGSGRLRQLADALGLAHRWNYSPIIYYRFRFWHPDVRPRALQFLQVHELALLQMESIGDAPLGAIANKAVFGEHCAEAKLPAVEVIARIRGDSEEWAQGEPTLPPHDLFVKPVFGEQGIGCELWNYDGEQWRIDGERRDAGQLLEHLRALAKRDEILVQPCLSNHPDVARVSAGSLSSFRVMTFVAEGANAARLMGVTLKVSRRGAAVDNIHAGGIACAVDPESGILGAGVGNDPIAMHRIHPDTGHPLEGVQLAAHQDAIDLALRAHDTLDVPWSVGWDIAATPEGPVLIEGNRLWSAYVYFGAHRAPMTSDFTQELLRRVQRS